jgi:two-component system response regulator FixJ
MTADPLVHVIDDDDAVRESLGFLLQSLQIRVQSYDSAKSFLATVPKLNGGCIITDVRMPEMTGLDLLRRLRELEVAMPVIVITGHGDLQLAVEAMKIGAVDFLEKPFSDEVLVASVRSALERWQQQAGGQAERNEVLDRLAVLSGRERQVLEGLVAGNPNKVIARQLDISPRTVEIYRAHVMVKMQAASLSDLVRMALIGGLLGEPAAKSASR